MIELRSNNAVVFLEVVTEMLAKLLRIELLNKGEVEFSFPFSFPFFPQVKMRSLHLKFRCRPLGPTVKFDHMRGSSSNFLFVLFCFVLFSTLVLMSKHNLTVDAFPYEI